MQSVMEPITPGPLPLITHISRELGASVQIMPLLSSSGNLSGFPLDRCSPHQNLYFLSLSLSHLCWPLTKPPDHSITFWFLFFEIMLHPPQHGNLNMISLWTDAVEKHFESIFNHFLRDRCRCRTIFRLLFNMFSSESDGVWTKPKPNPEPGRLNIWGSLWLTQYIWGLLSTSFVWNAALCKLIRCKISHFSTR